MNISLRDLFGPNHDDMINCDSRYLVVKGSRGSGKSTTVFRMIIMRMLYIWNKYRICPSVLIVRQWLTTHSNSTVIEIEKAIAAFHAQGEFKKLKSPNMFIHKKSGAQIIFRGMDDPTKLTSINAPTPLAYCVVEEAFELKTEEDFDKLDLSIRGELPYPLKHQIILMFNPYSDKHWLKAKFFDVQDETITSLTKTYMDNAFIQNDRGFINLMDKMKETNPKKFNILGLGNWGVAEGLVFDNYTVESFDYKKMLAYKNMLGSSKYRACYGADFGWEDPTTLACSLIDDNENIIYIYDEIYQNHITIKQFCDKIKEKGLQGAKIYCDSANPREIELMKSEGIRNAVPAYKGPNSIVAGIKLIQDYKIKIHPQCQNMLREIGLYCWDKDKISGKFLDTPIDKENHLIDSLRYSCYHKKAEIY